MRLSCIRILQLLMLILPFFAWSQTNISSGENGTDQISDTAGCMHQKTAGTDLSIKCSPKLPVSEKLSKKPKKTVIESDLEIAEKRLKQAAADRDSARKQYHAMVKQLRLNPEDHGAKRMVAVYEERLKEKMLVYADVEQKVLLLRLKSRLN